MILPQQFKDTVDQINNQFAAMQAQIEQLQEAVNEIRSKQVQQNPRQSKRSSPVSRSSEKLSEAG
jgi:prefoldin subunit 5